MRIELNREWTVRELLAALDGADPDTVLAFGRTPKRDQTGTCWCGCGGTTKGRFVPGHDSKFHSLAKQVARGQAEMPTEFVCDDAEADFMKWHDRDLKNPPKSVSKPKTEPKLTEEPTEEPAEVVSMESLDAADPELQELLAMVTMGE